MTLDSVASQPPCRDDTVEEWTADDVGPYNVKLSPPRKTEGIFVQ